MTKFVVYAVVVIGLSVTAVLANSNDKVTTTRDAEARYAADGAYRDGLYLGQLAAGSGLRSSPAIGRWALEQDREMFTVGYRRGYGAGQ